MAYASPPLASPLLLAGYAPPDLTAQTRLGAGYVAPRIGRISLGAFAPWPGALVVLCEGVEAQRILAALSAALPPNALPLTFSAVGGPPPSDIEGVLLAALSADTLPLVPALAVSHILGAVLAGSLAPDPLPLALMGALSVDPSLPDADGVRASLSAQPMSHTAAGLAVRVTDMLARPRALGARAQAAVRHASGAALQQRGMSSARSFSDLLDTHGIRLTGRTRATATETLRRSRSARLPATDAPRRVGSTALPHAERIRTRTPRRLAAQHAEPTAHRLREGHHEALPQSTRLAAPQTEATRPLPGRWWPRYTAPALDGVLCCLTWPAQPGGAVSLTWVFPRCAREEPPQPGTIVIPIRRIYRVLNSVLLTRVSDGAEIPADGLSLSLDADSWAWSWSARVPGTAVGLLMPSGEPQDLLATINGEPIRLLIDSISRAREFGSSWLSVRGRGRAAALAAPTAASVSRYNTEARTAQQLLIDALTVNGVGIGWAVDWRLEDWPVPAGAWSHTGSYIEAATRLAEAGGGYVQGHDTEQTLILQPYYPVAPWAWSEAIPDIEMPEDVCQTEGIEWVEKAAYNAVWITGGEGGRRDYVRRTGTDGLTMAQTIVDGLATDAIMTRQRGLRILADTGRQALISVKLPVIEETGIIKPGNLIRYTEQGVTRLGLSRAVSVDCGWPEVWQTIKLEAREA